MPLLLEAAGTAELWARVYHVYAVLASIYASGGSCPAALEELRGAVSLLQSCGACGGRVEELLDKALTLASSCSHGAAVHGPPVSMVLALVLPLLVYLLAPLIASLYWYYTRRDWLVGE